MPDRHTGAEGLVDALVRDIRARQNMVRSVLADEEEAKPLPFVGSMQMRDGVGAVLASIRQTIRLDLAEFRHRPLRRARSHYCDRGSSPLAFCAAYRNLGSHHTAIEVQAFRGFALSDDIAPFVVLNDQDARSAWSFTLVHELAHLWLGLTGVSGAFADAQIEKFCNDVASGFLLPTNELALVQVDRNTDRDIAARRIGDFARERHLSPSMVAYNLLRVGALTEESWRTLTGWFLAQWRRSRAAQRERQKTALDRITT